MATVRTITLPVKADTSHVIAFIDVIVKHLTALRDELATLTADSGTEGGDPK